MHSGSLTEYRYTEGMNQEIPHSQQDTAAELTQRRVRRHLVQRAWIQAQQMLQQLHREDHTRRRTAGLTLGLLVLVFAALTFLILNPESLAALARWFSFSG